LYFFICFSLVCNLDKYIRSKRVLTIYSSDVLASFQYWAFQTITGNLHWGRFAFIKTYQGPILYCPIELWIGPSVNLRYYAW
jgi:hypothetical protein